MPIRPVSTWAERKWYVDEFYRLHLVTPLKLISTSLTGSTSS